jgi:hypothetical protein
MKCIVTPEYQAPVLENESEGFKKRVLAQAISGSTPQGSALSLEVIIPFASSSTQMQNTVKSRVQTEFARIGVAIALNDILLDGISIA